MASKTLFQTTAGPLLPLAGARNEAGAPAYQLSPHNQDSIIF